MFKLKTKSEWFELPSPIGEPCEKWNKENKYHIERLTKEDGTIVWFGLSINWQKEKDSNWQVLTTNYDAKPLEKYLPEIVYGSDRMYWKDCETPIYEQFYIEYNKNNK